MRVVITGSNGFIGSFLVHKLKKVHEVIGVGRQKQNKSECQKYINMDITQYDNVIEKMKDIGKIDVLIHVAAEMTGEIETLYQTNCLGTKNIIEAVCMNGVKKILYISSLPVIGEPKTYPITELHSIEPKTAYHYTKLIGEHIVKNLSEKYKVKYAILRMASPVGKNMNPNKIFSVFVNQCIHRKNIIIWGDGKRVQNYLDIRDLAYAINKVLFVDVNGIFNIVGNSISDYDLAMKCKSYFQTKNEIIVKREEKLSSEKWIVSGEKAQRILNYIPQRSIDESIGFVAEGIYGTR